MRDPKDLLPIAFARFDAANAEDPNKDRDLEGTIYPKEVLYAIRMTHMLARYYPDADETLKLAARSQHIQRWKIPRDRYPMDRPGYLRWRNELKRFHAKMATEILEEVGYDSDTVQKTAQLLEKKQLKKNEEVQVLEDVVCLVFLQYYFEPFAKDQDGAKLIEILRKTWKKMSPDGQEAALKLPLSEATRSWIHSALVG